MAWHFSRARKNRFGINLASSGGSGHPPHFNTPIPAFPPLKAIVQPTINRPAPKLTPASIFPSPSFLLLRGGLEAGDKILSTPWLPKVREPTHGCCDVLTVARPAWTSVSADCSLDERAVTIPVEESAYRGSFMICRASCGPFVITGMYVATLGKHSGKKAGEKSQSLFV